MAYKKFAFPEVSMGHKLKARTVIPTMPSDPFALMEDLVAFMTSVTQLPDGSMPFLFNASLMTIWDAKHVPNAGNLHLVR